MSSATVPLLDDDTIPFGEEDLNQNKTYTHPYVMFFHIFFRAAAIITYMLCGWFSDSFITSFIFVIFLLSADFWTVKNVTGRLLVGLRWWNYVDDTGKSHWVFESKKGRSTTTYQQQGKTNLNEARLFWLALIFCPIIWGLFFLIALFGLKFKWLLLVMIALSLNCANLYGYIKCNFGVSKDLNSTATDFVRTQFLKNAVNFMAKSTTSSNQQQPTLATPTGIV